MTIYTNAILAKVKKAAMLAIVRGTESVRNEAVMSIMGGEKTGRIYQRYGSWHQASAPGQPPASDTGTLANSISTRYDFDKLIGYVNAGAKYSAFLEFGTMKMQPRPFMRPALEAKRKEIEADIQASVAAELK